MQGAKNLRKKKKETYNTGYSLIVTDLTTNPALTSLSTWEQTGPTVFSWVWPYVIACMWTGIKKEVHLSQGARATKSGRKVR